MMMSVCIHVRRIILLLMLGNIYLYDIYLYNTILITRTYRLIFIHIVNVFAANKQFGNSFALQLLSEFPSFHCPYTFNLSLIFHF